MADKLSFTGAAADQVGVLVGRIEEIVKQHPAAAGVHPGSHPLTRFTRAELEAARDRLVPDVVADGLPRAVLRDQPGSDDRGDGPPLRPPRQPFLAGAASVRLHAAAAEAVGQGELPSYGLGITNVVARASARADKLTAEEYREGGRLLALKVARLRPRWLAVVGVTAYRAAFDDRKAQVGPAGSGRSGTRGCGCCPTQRAQRALDGADDGGGVRPAAGRGRRRRQRRRCGSGEPSRWRLLRDDGQQPHLVRLVPVGDGHRGHRPVPAASHRYATPARARRPGHGSGISSSSVRSRTVCGFRGSVSPSAGRGARRVRRGTSRTAPPSPPAPPGRRRAGRWLLSSTATKWLGPRHPGRRGRAPPGRGRKHSSSMRGDVPRDVACGPVNRPPLTIGGASAPDGVGRPGMRSRQAPAKGAAAAHSAVTAGSGPGPQSSLVRLVQDDLPPPCPAGSQVAPPPASPITKDTMRMNGIRGRQSGHAAAEQDGESGREQRHRRVVGPAAQHTADLLATGEVVSRRSRVSLAPRRPRSGEGGDQPTARTGAAMTVSSREPPPVRAGERRPGRAGCRPRGTRTTRPWRRRRSPYDLSEHHAGQGREPAGRSPVRTRWWSRPARRTPW